MKEGGATRVSGTGSKQQGYVKAVAQDILNNTRPPEPTRTSGEGGSSKVTWQRAKGKERKGGGATAGGIRLPEYVGGTGVGSQNPVSEQSSSMDEDKGGTSMEVEGTPNQM